MGNVSYKKDQEKNIHLIARSDVSESRTIATFSPLDGKKQLVDFGLNLKQVTMLVYSTKEINAKKELKVFSEEFQGKIQNQSVSINKYSGTPYMYVNITGIGEDKNTTDIKKPTDLIHTIRGLEDFYMISYQTTYLGQIGTGFSLSVTKKKIHKDGIIEFKYDNKNYVLGSDKAIVSGYGQSLSRMSYSTVNNFIDPLSLELQKAVIISSLEEDNSQLNEVVDMNKLVYFDTNQLMSMLQKIQNGDLSELIKELFSDNLVQIELTKIKKSPIIQSLSNTKANNDINAGQMKNLFYSQIVDNLIKPGIFNVGSILTQILPMFNLELYHKKDNIYSLEPPRYLFFDDDTKSDIKIELKDVISVNLQKPITSIANVMIPSMDFQNIALHGVANECALHFASKLIKKLQKFIKLPIIKIQTYELPNILIPVSIKEDKDTLFDATTQYLSKIWVYYSSFIFQSVFGRLDTGSINLTFRPDIIEPYKWYKIDEEWLFVTGIRHDVSRGNLNTSLTYSHRYTPEIMNFFQDMLKVDNKGHNICETTIKNMLKKNNIKKSILNKTSEKKPNPGNKGSTPINDGAYTKRVMK